MENNDLERKQHGKNLLSQAGNFFSIARENQQSSIAKSTRQISQVEIMNKKQEMETLIAKQIQAQHSIKILMIELGKIHNRLLELLGYEEEL